MPQLVTFLQPVSRKAPVSKTFILLDGNPTAKESPTDERMGKMFTWRTVQCRDLEHLQELFLKLELKRVFRIYGTPKDELEEKVQRLKVNFPAGETYLIHIDVDKWLLPVGCSVDSIDSLTEALDSALRERGLGLLADATCLVLQSSSAFGKTDLRVHLYFWLTKPIELEAFRKWALAFNKLAGEKVLDPQVYVGVQPDFIAKRRCEGFADPMPPEMRMFIMEGMSREVDTDKLMERMLSDLKDAQMLPADATSVDSVGGDEPLGKTWAESLKLAGKDGGDINAVAYRAAAQLVSAEGTHEVKRRLNEFAERFHTALWNAITENNPDGERGGPDDRANYSLAKCRDDYIKSALDKDFGDRIDEMVSLIESVIEDIKLNILPASSIFEADHIEALKYISDKYPQHWSDLRNKIKKDLKGKIKISDLDKKVRTVYDLTDDQIAEQIMKENDWVQDEHDNLYLRDSNSNNYSIQPLSDSMGAIMEQCAELRGGKAPSNGLLTFVVSKLKRAAESKKRSPFKKETIRKRSFTDLSNGKLTAWINVREQPDGEQRVVRIDEDDIKMPHAKTAPVLWQTVPKVKSITLPKAHAIKQKFDLPDKATKEECLEACVQHLIERVPYFFRCKDNEETIDLLGFAINDLMGVKLKLLLQLIGPTESGKSTAGDFMLDLISPAVEDFLHHNARTIQGTGEKEYCQLMKDRDIPYFDNLTKLTNGEQMFFTQVLTGITKSNRVLYQRYNEELPFFNSMIITGLYNMVHHQDLQTRTVTKEFGIIRYVEGNKIPIEQEWVDDVPFLRMGLYEMVRRALGEHRLNKMDVNRRDYWHMLAKLTVAYEVMGTYDQNEVLEKIESQLEEKRVGELFGNKYAGTVTAWLMSDPDLQSYNPIFKKKSVWFRQYRDWCDANVGSVFRIGYDEVEITYDEIVGGAIPFSGVVNRCAAEMKNLTGLDFYSSKQRGGMFLVFEREGEPKVDIEKIE